MHDAVAELNRVLSEEQRCVDFLLSLAEQETTALKENDVELLSHVCGKTAAAAGQLTELEKQRLIIHQEVADMLQVPEDTNLSELLAPLLSGEYSNLAGEVSCRSKSLKTACEKLREHNRLNHLLIRQSLSYVQTLLAVFNGGNARTYHKDGEEVHRIFDSLSLNRTV